MAAVRGVQTREGWWVKAKKDGKPIPLLSRLAKAFHEANVDTVCGAFDYGKSKYGPETCMSTRKLLKRETYIEGGKKMEKLKLGEYESFTYDEISKEVNIISCNLAQLGLKKFSKVAIFSETRKEWLQSAIACLKNRITICTLYTTLNELGLAHAINETEVNVIFTSYDQMARLMSVIKMCPNVSKIVIMEDQLEGEGNFQIPSEIEAIAFKSLLNSPISPKSNETPQASDIAILMYTSGTTGTPKGVELNHTSILASATAYSVQMNVGEGDRYLAFLPLAHIMELVTEIALLSLGVKIYYSSPHTLTSKSMKILEGTVGDAKLAKPTTMNAVPLVMDRIIKGVNHSVNSQGKLKSVLFHSVVKYKFWLDYIPFASSFFDILMFNKVKAELGGELKRLIVGGAPLSPNTHHKIRAMFGCSLQVGYGSTETAACISGMDEDDYITGYTGGPNLNVILKLQDWPEGGYLLIDKPHPRGEIIVGGTVVANGYFKRDQETIGAFYEEDGQRWFRTGDIGVLDSNGCLKIVDRMKDLVKLKHGEYVSLGNAESKLKTLPIVENICVFAEGTKERVVAVIVPVKERLLEKASSVGIENINDFNTVCNDPHFKEIVLKDLQKHGRSQGLTRWEIPADLFLATEEWTPDSGLVTAALKLRRKQIGIKYQNMVSEMYSRLDD